MLARRAMVLLAIMVIGCTPASSGYLTIEPPGSPGPDIVSPESMSINVSNGTTLAVSLAVNGRVVGVVAAGQQDAFLANVLPSLPWELEARSPSGRILASMVVRAGDVRSTTTPGGGVMQGDGVRADFSCGRLDIWSGPPLVGPAPGPGSPDDCAP